MNTNDLREAGQPQDAARPGDGQEFSGAAPSYLPDVASIAQLANEFFKALPQQGMQAFMDPSVLSSVAPAPEMRLPQFGATALGIAALPSEGAVPDPTAWQKAAATGSPSNLPGEFSSAQISVLPLEESADMPVAFGRSVFSPSQMQAPFSVPLPELDLAIPFFGAEIPASFLLFQSYPSGVTQAEQPSFYFLEQAIAPSETAPETQKSSVEFPSTPKLELPRRQFDVASIRRDFPILNERVNGHPLIWLDNAATTQKPQAVIDRISYFYEHENSNIHRAAHELAARATDAYEDARQKVANFLNATSTKEIVFARGATEAINLVAKSWGSRHIQKDDEIVITWIEHHANIVPWQMLAAEKGARLRVVPVDDDGQVLLDEFEKLLNQKTRLVSITQVSNALGTITPVHKMVQMAHRYGARVLVDGAQAVSHMRVDVQSIDCDFYVFSGHKVFAPTGIGVLYGKPEALADSPPWQGGGNMIVDVTFEKTIYQPPPSRFEAGTGSIADAVGLGAAIDYIGQIGMENIARHEHDLLIYATQLLLTISGLRIIGTAKEKAGVLSFVLNGFKTEEVGAALNREGIAVRSGHHCAQPTLRRFGVESTVRPSLALYNNYEDIDALIAALRRLRQTRP
jgi:cysteine desulfurase / selenocysteine lyase